MVEHKVSRKMSERKKAKTNKQRRDRPKKMSGRKMKC